MTSWFILARHVQQKLRLKQYQINNAEIIHLTALAILIEKCIDTQTSNDRDKHHLVFQKTYQVNLRDDIRQLSNEHNLFACAEKRSNDNKEETRTCDLCDTLDDRIQLLRFTRARYDVYEGCYQYVHLRPLLYDMSLMYVLLRNASRNQIDMYLFLQTTYAIIKLHCRHTILLNKNTKNRYFVLWLMYFTHYFTDSHIVFKDWHEQVPFKSVERIHELWTSLCSLLFVRRYLIPSDDLFLCNSMETWQPFVDQLNRTSEIVSVRKSFGHVPFLFTLDVRPFFDMG